MTPDAELGRTDLLDWAVAGRPFQGQRHSGDVGFVVASEAVILAAVIDGLGHGMEAAAAAQAAAEVLLAEARRPVGELVGICHERLRRTRGAVMSLASFDGRDATVTWTGVGNVEGMLLRARRLGPAARESLLLRSGVVGDRIPTPQASRLEVGPGDVLVLATDGVRPGFEKLVVLDESVQRVADSIIARHARSDDDALVLVARWRGRQG